MYIDILELGVVTRTVQVLRTTSGTSTSTGIYSYCTQYIQIYCIVIVLYLYGTSNEYYSVRSSTCTAYGVRVIVNEYQYASTVEYVHSVRGTK